MISRRDLRLRLSLSPKLGREATRCTGMGGSFRPPTPFAAFLACSRSLTTLGGRKKQGVTCRRKPQVLNSLAVKVSPFILPPFLALPEFSHDFSMAIVDFERFSRRGHLVPCTRPYQDSVMTPLQRLQISACSSGEVSPSVSCYLSLRDPGRFRGNCFTKTGCFRTHEGRCPFPFSVIHHIEIP